MNELKYINNKLNNNYTHSQLVTFLESEVESARTYARSLYIFQALTTLLLYLYTPSSVTARLWGNIGITGDVISVIYIVSLVLLTTDFLFRDILKKEFIKFTKFRWVPISAMAITYWLTATMSLLNDHAGGLGILTAGYCILSIWGISFAWHVKTTDYRFRDFLLGEPNDKL